METLTADVHDTARPNETPAGTLVRTCALGTAIGFSLLVGAMILALPDLAATAMVWTLWGLITVASVLTYTVGNTVSRHSHTSP